MLPALPPRQRAESAAQHLLVILPALELAITPDPSRAPLTSSSHARSSEHPSRPPWSPPVASAIFAVGRAVFLVESLLRDEASQRVTSIRFKDVSGGIIPTTLAMTRSLRFIQGAVSVASHSQAEEAAIRLERSLHSSLQALGSEERWSPLPRLPHSPPPRCPMTCNLRSLRMRPLQGRVRCITPGCRDSAGYPHPEANALPRRSETNTGLWEWHLVWTDGTEGIPVRTPQEEREKEAEAIA